MNFEIARRFAWHYSHRPSYDAVLLGHYRTKHIIICNRIIIYYCNKCLCDYLLSCEKSIVFGSMVQIVRYNVSMHHFVNNLVYSQLSTYAYNSANTQCITTLTTGVMFIKHLPHSCVSLNVIRKMKTNLDGIFKYNL